MLTVLNAGQHYHVRGGSDQYLLALERLLRANGHKVVPFAAQHENNDASEWAEYFPQRVDFEQPGLADIARYLYNPSAGRSAARLVDAAQPDIAHLHIYYGQLGPAVLRAIASRGVPIVQTLHEYKLVCPTYSMVAHGRVCEACKGGRYYQAVLQRCNRSSIPRSALSATESYVSRSLGGMRKVARFIAVSKFQRAKLVEMGAPEERIRTVHNFIDAAGIAPNEQHGEYFLYFGRLEAIKGIWTLLEAVADQPDLPLIIAGTGAEEAAVKAYVQERGLNHVRLVGFQDPASLAQLIRGSLCTLTPSRWYETFGLTSLESLAHSRPVIASAIGGIPEVIDDDKDGFLVPAGNSAALRERMRWMLDHPADAFAMGQHGRQRVLKQFTPQAHYDALMRVYQEVL